MRVQNAAADSVSLMCWMYLNPGNVQPVSGPYQSKPANRRVIGFDDIGHTARFHAVDLLHRRRSQLFESPLTVPVGTRSTAPLVCQKVHRCQKLDIVPGCFSNSQRPVHSIKPFALSRHSNDHLAARRVGVHRGVSVAQLFEFPDWTVLNGQCASLDELDVALQFLNCDVFGASGITGKANAGGDMFHGPEALEFSRAPKDPSHAHDATRTDALHRIQKSGGANEVEDVVDVPRVTEADFIGEQT